jgi:methionine aminopeptidase
VPSRVPGFRGVDGFTDSYIAVGQTDPPSIPIFELFRGGPFPAGQVVDHPGDFNTFRVTSEEKRALDRASSDVVETLREAAEVHRHVRKYAQSMIKPGMKLADFCEALENKNRELVKVRESERARARGWGREQAGPGGGSWAQQGRDVRHSAHRNRASPVSCANRVLTLTHTSHACRRMASSAASRSPRACRSTTWRRTIRPTRATTRCCRCVLWSAARWRTAATSAHVRSTPLPLAHPRPHLRPSFCPRTPQYGDVMKVDFGTQINGRIIDCAWTVAFDPQFDPLLAAVKEATNAGIAAAGIDARLGEVGATIQEVMESHEVTIGGKAYPIKSIRNLNGHSIGPWHIHAGKSVPIIKTAEQTKMEEGELYAIETFGSTGRGYVEEDLDCSHFMRNYDVEFAPLRLPAAKKLLGHINKTFGTLAFCRCVYVCAVAGGVGRGGGGGGVACCAPVSWTDRTTQCVC